MLSFDERLRAAARIAGDAIMVSYVADAEPDHQFSPEFEQKMNLLIRQAGRKTRYRVAKSCERYPRHYHR